jgi:hypothetical protein
MPDTPWFRTAEGRVRLFVLREFRFIFPDQRARRFDAGEHVLDPADADDAAVLAHPWVARDFADGHVEPPQRTLARLEAAATAAAADLQRQAATRAEWAFLGGTTP